MFNANTEISASKHFGFKFVRFFLFRCICVTFVIFPFNFVVQLLLNATFKWFGCACMRARAPLEHGFNRAHVMYRKWIGCAHLKLASEINCTAQKSHRKTSVETIFLTHTNYTSSIAVIVLILNLHITKSEYRFYFINQL